MASTVNVILLHIPTRIFPTLCTSSGDRKSLGCLKKVTFLVLKGDGWRGQGKKLQVAIIGLKQTPKQHECFLKPQTIFASSKIERQLQCSKYGFCPNVSPPLSFSLHPTQNLEQFLASLKSPGVSILAVANLVYW